MSMSMREPEFWNSPSGGARALRALLSPLGSLYGASVAWKRKSAHPYRPQARVLCIGNLTAGGTGKTPVAQAFGRLLEERGCKTAFLTRGYGGSVDGPVLADPVWHTAADVGDEPLLLAGTARTIVAKDRAQGAVFADRNHVDVIVMDDGFQNFDIVKDASVVVVDSETGFGNGLKIPAGPMRESVDGLERADAIVLMGDAPSPLPPTKVPVMRAHLAPNHPVMLEGRRMVAFAGIGRPQKFFDMLRQVGANVIETASFPDHHVFTGAEMTQLFSAAMRHGAELVTTEKDYYRLPMDGREGITPIPVHVVFDDHALVERILDQVMPAPEERMR
jgi:tetraacyldisaccharide 4'-kinase